MTNALAIWILSLMHLLQPAAPWIDTYGETAAAIAASASTEPFYAGPDGVVRTAAVLVSLSWFESRFDTQAVGDGGSSLCLGQVNQSNFKALRVTRAEMLLSRSVCLHAMRIMIRTSFSICWRHPQSESLANYASGGASCTSPDALTKSHHRMGLALRLLREHPFFFRAAS